MLVFLKLGADFSRGCAGGRIGHSHFATHPAPRFANRSGQRRALGGCELYAVGTHYQSLLECGVGGARL
jgi:hypothetical protein